MKQAIIAAFVLILIFMVLIKSSETHSRYFSKTKSCLANLRSMESAVEMYNMETDDGPMITLDKDRLKKYFLNKKFPPCPNGGEYSLVKPGEFVVCCSIHGTVDNPTNADEMLRKDLRSPLNAALFLTMIIFTAIAEIRRMFVKKSDSRGDE